MLSLPVNASTTSPISCYDNSSNLLQVNPDPDIAGLGVLISFLATGWLTWALAVAAYVTGTIPARLLNSCDRHLFRIKPEPSTPWAKTVEPLVLLLSDQQLVTGIALLIAAFARFGSINVLHWQIVTATAWMSSMTHLTTLTLLRSFLQENPRIRNWRLGGMLILFGLLFAAEIPLANDNAIQCLYNPFLYPDGDGLYDTHPSPAVSGQPSNVTDGPNVGMRCMWPFDESATNSVGTDGVLALIFLLLSYAWKVVLLFHPSETFSKAWLRLKLQKWLEMRLRKRSLLLFRRGANHSQDKVLACLAVVYVGFLSVCDYVESFAVSLFWLTGGILYGTLRIAYIKSISNSIFQDQQDAENSWSFGQIMPLCLLVIPLMSAFELYESFRRANMSHGDELAAGEEDGPCRSTDSYWTPTQRRHSINLPLIGRSERASTFAVWLEKQEASVTIQQSTPSWSTWGGTRVQEHQSPTRLEEEASPERFMTGADIALAMASTNEPVDWSPERIEQFQTKIVRMRRYRRSLALLVVSTGFIESAIIVTWHATIGDPGDDFWQGLVGVTVWGIFGTAAIGFGVLCWAYFKDRSGRLPPIHED